MAGKAHGEAAAIERQLHNAIRFYFDVPKAKAEDFNRADSPSVDGTDRRAPHVHDREGHPRRFGRELVAEHFGQ